MKKLMMALTLLSSVAFAQKVHIIGSSYALKNQVGPLALAWQCSSLTATQYINLNANKDDQFDAYLDCANDVTKKMNNVVMNTTTGKILIDNEGIEGLIDEGRIIGGHNFLDMNAFELSNAKKFVLLTANAKWSLENTAYIYDEKADSLSALPDLNDSLIIKQSLKTSGWDKDFASIVDSEAMVTTVNYSSESNDDKSIGFTVDGICPKQDGGYQLTGELSLEPDSAGKIVPVLKNIQGNTAPEACTPLTDN